MDRTKRRVTKNSWALKTGPQKMMISLNSKKKNRTSSKKKLQCPVLAVVEMLKCFSYRIEVVQCLIIEPDCAMCLKTF